MKTVHHKDALSIFLGSKLVSYILTIGIAEMDIIWPIKNKIFAYAEKKTTVKFVTQQLKIMILVCLVEEEELSLVLDKLLLLLLQIGVFFVIKDVVVMGLGGILSAFQRMDQLGPFLI